MSGYTQNARVVRGDEEDLVKVGILNYHGIEINDFAVVVARTALCIAEHKMNLETEKVVRRNLKFLPLKRDLNIVEGNSLEIPWEDVVCKERLSYIIGNPPFVGNSKLSPEQKKERAKFFKKDAGKLDYVCCWFKKAADFIDGTYIRCAFVSTNSICQGQQVVPLWKPLFNQGIKIDFAWKSFKWSSEAGKGASVAVIIIGFSKDYVNVGKMLFSMSEGLEVDNINGYLYNLNNIFVENRSTPLCNVPKITKGIEPDDGGWLLLSEEEKNSFIKNNVESSKFIRKFMTGRDFINGKHKYCLWLVNASSKDIDSIVDIKDRVVGCQYYRTTGGTVAYSLKDVPHLLGTRNGYNVDSAYVAFSVKSSGGRNYIPADFVIDGTISSDALFVMSNAGLFNFSLLVSRAHKLWVDFLANVMESGSVVYSNTLIYNTFPFPMPTDEQKARIEEAAQGILDARDLYSDWSLADLYDPKKMPPELRKAHEENDRAVMEAYGFEWGMSEEEILNRLMQMYQDLTQ